MLLLLCCSAAAAAAAAATFRGNETIQNNIFKLNNEWKLQFWQY